jgi:hypothetical protein
MKRGQRLLCVPFVGVHRPLQGPQPRVVRRLLASWAQQLKRLIEILGLTGRLAIVALLPYRNAIEMRGSPGYPSQYSSRFSSAVPAKQ